MKSWVLYRRMFTFLLPYLPYFLTTIPLSALIASTESAGIWFAATLPGVLFGNYSPDLTQIPTLSIATINDYLKYQTYTLLTAADGISPLMMGCLLMVLFYTLKNVLTYINNLLSIQVFTGFIMTIRERMFAHLCKLPVSFYDKSESGAIMALMLNEVEKIKVAATGSIQSLFTEPIRIIISITLLLSINWKLTLLVFIIYPILGFMIVKIGQSIKRRSTRELQSFSDMLASMGEIISGIRIVKMFNAITLEINQFDRKNSHYTKCARKSERMRMLTTPLTETLFMYAAAGLLFVGGYMAVSQGVDNFSPDDFIKFLVILSLSYQPFKKLAGVNSSIQTGIAAAARFFKVLDEEEEPHEENSSSIKKPTLNSEIRFDDVWFRYPGTERFVLKGISFTIKKGEMVAIVGSSGAGKSTILDLIPRFYDIEKGTITIDGVDIKTVGLRAIREQLGIVAQENFLFNGTFNENIAYGASTQDQERIEAAAKAANALKFIQESPDGFNTQIGERGVALSGGQRQRLAIARALYHNAPLLIFDEATSSLDTESERLVQKAIDNVVLDRTVLVVAHRLSTVKHADRIIVLEDGNIVETGTHDELISKGGRYKKLCDMQLV